MGLESDFGADRIWRLETNFRESNPPLHERLAVAVARFGVADSGLTATGGADLNIVRDQGGALIDLQQDGTRYFDLHHTPDDTLDKIDPVQLRQNVAVWTQGGRHSGERGEADRGEVMSGALPANALRDGPSTRR